MLDIDEHFLKVTNRYAWKASFSFTGSWMVTILSSVLVICFELDVLCHKHSYITQIFSFEIRSYQSICFTLFTELLFLSGLNTMKITIQTLKL